MSATNSREEAPIELRHGQATANPPEAAFADRVLTPRSLGSRLEGLRFFIFGTCQVEHLAVAAADYGYAADHMLYGSWVHSEIPRLDASRYDAAIVGLTLRTILQDAIGRSTDVAHVRDFWTLEAATDAFERCCEIITQRVSAVAASFQAVPSFFTAFFEPSFDYFGGVNVIADLTNAKVFVRRLNERLAESVRSLPNCFFFDVNEILNRVGRLHLQDDVVTHSTHASIIGGWDDAFDVDRFEPVVSNLVIFDVDNNLKRLQRDMFDTLADNMKIIRQEDIVKIIIIDLDDTLWRGVAADDTMDVPTRTEGWPLGFMEALLYFKRRGGLLAIASKNDHAPTVERFKDICRDRIQIEDFISIKINWKEKSHNVAEILGEVNLLPESAVFIDDNPREIDEVRSRFPTLRTLGGSPRDWRRIILRSPETQVAHVSSESRDRTRLVRARLDREAAALTMSRDQWLSSLQLEQGMSLIDDIADPKFDRAMELINKTNQFNTTGKRWTLVELDQFFRDGGRCLVTSLKDKMVDNGIVGAVLLEPGAIVQAVLSCRVFGLGAEVTMGSTATAVALAGAASVRAAMVDTGKNFTCHDYFERLGFVRDGDAFVANSACSIPTWVSVTLGRGLG